jgi:hypothetical protein
MHSARLGRTRQTNQPQPLEMRIPGLAFSRMIGSLTAPLQVPDETAAHVPVDLPVHASGIPKGKVVRPAFPVPIQLSNQDRDRLEALMTVSHLVQLLSFSLDRFLRRKHIQIFPSASFQIAVVPKRVSQKVQTRPFFPQVHHPCLFPVDL